MSQSLHSLHGDGQVTIMRPYFKLVENMKNTKWAAKRCSDKISKMGEKLLYVKYRILGRKDVNAGSRFEDTSCICNGRQTT